MSRQRMGEYYAAVYGIMQNDSGEYLFQRRANTGFNDGLLQFPSGHIEGSETYFEALKREILEEIGIHIEEKDVSLRHVLHRVSKTGRVYFDIFLEIHNYSGNISNAEPEKCSEVGFYCIDNPDVTPYNKKVIEDIQKGLQISEIMY